MANGQRVGYLLWPHANERKVLCDAAEKRKKSWENSVGEAVRFPFPREQDVCHVSGAAVPVIFQTLPASRKKKTNDTNKFSVAKQRESAKIRREKRYLVYTENYFEVSSSWYILAYCIKLKIRNS